MTEGSGVEILAIPAADAPSVLDVMCDAFALYPVMRFVLGAGGDYDGRLRRLIELFVMARVLREDPMFGVADGDTLRAAVTLSFPGGDSPPTFGALRAQVWADLGADARTRYDACV